MFRKMGFFPVVVLAALVVAPAVCAQTELGAHARPRITQSVDETNRVVLAGNTHPEAVPENDRGAVANDFPMEHMLLQLKRSPEQEQALQQFIDELQTKGSPSFHRWLTAQEFGERFGVAKPDLDVVTSWLESYGFRVNLVYSSGMLIDFSGTASQVRRAFETEIHHLEVKGERHVGNISDPRIPAALAPVVAGIVSLHDFRPRAMHRMRTAHANFTFTDTNTGANNYAVVPADLATIYNLNPLFSAGYSGQSQSIVLIEDTDVFSSADWSTFRSTFGLSSYTSASFTSLHPAPSSGTNNCGAPGIIAPNDAEAILDAEWASAAAPSAAIVMAACADTTTTFGGLIAMQNLLNGQNPPPALMSISYGQCETVNGAAANASYNSAYQLAVTEGVSVFVAAGDSGAAGCDNSATAATHGIAVNAFASTPYNVAVGGTDFSDTFSNTNSTYWNSTNTSTYGSALSYIPEIPWNNSCAGALLSQYEGYSSPSGPNSLCNDPLLGSLLQTTVAGGGGPSACATGTPSINSVVSGTCQGWPKPSWQSVLGNPNDGVRDTPDVSLFAADGLWSHFYIFCWSDTKNGGATCGADPSTWSGAGGTSFASPIMAGIQALVNQKTGSRQGNPNPAYYQLAASEYGSSGNSSCNSTNGNNISNACVFYDVTMGDMAVNCTGNYNCFLNGAASGVLSTSNNAYQPAYGTNTGWDFATGMGTVNAANLVNNWPSSTSQPSFTLSASPTNLAILQGAAGSTTITINPLNGFSGSVNLTASGLPGGVSATFATNPATTSSLLTLSATGTAATGTVTVTITGTSGSLTNTATVSLTVNPQGSYTLSASPNTLTIVQGASGASTIAVTPQSGFNGTVSLAASGLPSGVSASFNPTSTTSTSALTLTASSTATTGTVTVTVTGTSGNLTGTTTISLTVNPPPTYTLSASPNSLTITQGASATSAITITPLNGFNGSVSLSASGLPGGVTASFNPPSTTGSSTLTLTASSTAATGTVTVTVTGTSGSLTKTTTISLTVRTMPTLPSVWNDGDIGSVGLAGSASYANGTFTVAGAGQGTFSTNSDGFHFVYQPLSGDGTMVARVVSLQGSSAAQAGIMVRETLDPGASHVFLFDYSSAIWMTERTSAGATSSYQSLGSASLPYWVKLVRSGNSFTLYSAADGANWVQLGSSQTVTMAQNVYLGLAVTSRSTSSLATGTFDSVSVSSAAAPAPVITAMSATTGSIGSQVVITGSGFGATQGGSAVLLNGAAVTINTWSGTSITITVPAGATSGPLLVSVAPSMNDSNAVRFTVTSQPLPTPWLDRDVGTVGLVGSAAYAGGTFTVLGAGLGTFSTNSDGFHFVYQPLAGDGTMVARVVNLQGSNAAQAGIMVRETLDAAATHVFLFDYSSALWMTERTSAGASSSYQPLGSVTLPYWIKLVRSGNVFTMFDSADGVNWVQLGSSQTFSMAQNVYVGLAATSRNSSALATATFDNVSLTTPAPPAPNFSLSTSPTSLTIIQGGTGASTISVTPQNGFNGNVSLSASGLPNGVTAAFNPSSTASTSTLTLTVSGTAATGTATLTITGTSGNLTNTTTVSLTVNPQGSYTLSASPSNLSITQGASGASTILVTPQNGFNSNVSLSASGLPSGVTASFNPSSTASTSMLTLTASGTAPIGTATVTITGTSSNLTSTTTVSLTVNPQGSYALNASPNSLNIMQGTNGATTITVTPQSGFNSSVSLSASGLPSGVTASFNPNSTTSTSTLTLTASGTATTGTVTLTVTGTSGNLTGSTALTLTVVAAPPPSLPSVWTDADVGSVGVAGNGSFANGTFTVAGAGQGTFSTSSDGFNFVYQPLSGDGTIVARIVGVQGSTAAQTGIMIRETLNPGASHVYLFNYSSAIWMTERTSTGASSSYQSLGSATLPAWIKLARAGNVFSMYGSSDGMNWGQLGTNLTVSMASNVYIGLAVSNRTLSSLATATFDSVSVSTAAAPAPAITAVSATTGSIGSQVVITGSGFGATQGGSAVLLNGSAATINSWSSTSITMTIPVGASSGLLLVSVAPNMNDSNAVRFTVTSQPLPASWLDQDVGSVGLVGSATYANGTFTVAGAGQGTFSTNSDGFHFAYQPLSGDGTIIARIASVQGSTAAQTGIMIRETLNAGANHIYLFNYSSALWITERISTGASSSYQSLGSTTLPSWIKLVRRGNVFTMYGSSDGVNWTQLGTSQTISMATNVYIGLAVSNRTLSSLATATYNNVSITSP